jgi:hypothetical protein
MSLLAYPDGVDQLKNEDEWEDTVVSVYESQDEKVPDEISDINLDSDIETKAKRELLRKLHAKRAVDVVKQEYKNPRTGDSYYLIDSPETRNQFGHQIGKIASSHSLNVAQLENELSGRVGSPGTYPNEWEVDPIKLACLLRTADIIHIDSRRAPYFLNTLKHPNEESQRHWTFQQKLNQPILDKDRLKFTTIDPFKENESKSWWLCYDTIKAIDNELRQVDNLLADLGKERLEAKKVACVDDPKRFSQDVEVSGWVPVNTKVQVSDVAGLVKKLGGSNLYGNNTKVPLRELTQNAADAVRARRKVDNRSGKWGSIFIRVYEEKPEYIIEIRDNGVGMSQKVLSTKFLDFGESGWKSDIIKKEFPGLVSSGFQPTGKFGIGFFSVFMWTNKVKVYSRRYDTGLKDTSVLEFDEGIDSRPMLRKANNNEQLQKGGTTIKVFLKDDPFSKGGVLFNNPEEERDIHDLCEHLFPAIDIDLFSKGVKDDEKHLTIEASDWKEINNEELISRISRKDINTKNDLGVIEKQFIENIQKIKDNNGDCLARAGICPNDKIRDNLESWSSPGVITVDGIRSTPSSNFAGIISGKVTRASRDSALPQLSIKKLSNWATEQAEKINDIEQLSEESSMRFASIVRSCGGRTSGLPVGFDDNGYINSKEICNCYSELNTVKILQYAGVRNLISTLGVGFGSVDLKEGIILTRVGLPSLITTRNINMMWPTNEELDKVYDSGHFGFYARTLIGVIIESLSNSWNVNVKEILDKSYLDLDDVSEEKCGTELVALKIVLKPV